MMRLKDRLKRLEELCRRVPQVTWPEVKAAQERIRERVLAKVRAGIAGRDLLTPDGLIRAKDEAVLQAWSRQRRSADVAEPYGLLKRRLGQLRAKSTELCR